MKQAIQAFKYHKILSFRLFFHEILIDFLIHHPSFRDVDVILPVPLHPSRYKEREFNQAEILARGLSHSFHIPLITNAVFRIKKTKPQVGLSMKERRSNLQSAFEVRNDSLIKDRRILIIDDVITSRSTVESLSMVMRLAGCQAVLVLALATGK